MIIKIKKGRNTHNNSHTIIVYNRELALFSRALLSKRRIQIVKVRSGITTKHVEPLYTFQFPSDCLLYRLRLRGAFFMGTIAEKHLRPEPVHREILRIYIGIQFNSSHSLNTTRKWMSFPAWYKVSALSADNRISPNLRVEFKYGWTDTIATSHTTEIHMMERRRKWIVFHVFWNI